MKCIIALENIRSVYNVGSIFRTMEGFGFSEVALIGITPSPIDKKGEKRKDFIKTALGAEERIAWKSYATISEVCSEYPDAQVISIEAGVGGVPLSLGVGSISANATYVCIFGSEVDGVSAEALALTQETWYIRMYGTKESFNVSVTAGIVLYELSRHIHK